MATYLETEYKLYDDQSESTIVVRESIDIPGLTDITQSERVDGAYKELARVTLRDEDIPLLMEALSRRYNDSKGSK